MGGADGLSPAHAGSYDADALRAPQLQHTVQHADGDGHLSRLTPIRLRTKPIANNALPARNIGLDQSAPIVARGFLPSHAAVLGNGLDVPVALRRRGLGRLARHGAGAWRHNDRRLWMALRHDSVNVVSIVSAITCDGGNGTIHLIEQGADPGAIIDLRPSELGCEDLTRIGIHTDVELPPGPTCPAPVFFDQPLPRPAEPQARAIHEQMHRLATW